MSWAASVDRRLEGPRLASPRRSTDKVMCWLTLLPIPWRGGIIAWLCESTAAEELLPASGVPRSQGDFIAVDGEFVGN